MGVLYAGPVADGIAFVLAAILLVIEVKKLKKTNFVSEALIADTQANNQNKEYIVITISREYGSGGRYIGRLVANQLGINFYDKELIHKVAEKTGLSEEYIENNEQKRALSDNLNNGIMQE